MCASPRLERLINVSKDIFSRKQYKGDDDDDDDDDDHSVDAVRNF